jgi:type II secretory pathway pseudopilin PulG
MRGHTLLELLVVLLLCGVTAASVAPAARRQRDRALVLAAREAVVAVVAAARLAAIEAGGASVRIATVPPTARAIADGQAIRGAALAADFGVTLDLGGGAQEVELAYDGLGLGKVASQTLTLRRGSEAAQLVISGYGRVRRR